MARDIPRSHEAITASRCKLDIHDIDRRMVLGESAPGDPVAVHILHCIRMGHIQRRPFTADEIAYELKIPRATVQNKIKKLMGLKPPRVRAGNSADDLPPGKRAAFFINEEWAWSPAYLEGSDEAIAKLARIGLAIQALHNSEALQSAKTGAESARIATDFIDFGKVNGEENGLTQ